MNVKELFREYDSKHYNNLMSVEGANRIARTDDALDEFLAGASQLFVSHGVQSCFGVALLHRHHDCDKRERMIQHARTVNNESALVTQPVAKEIDYCTEVPWIWELSEGKFYPMEFTTDETARSLFTDKNDVPEVFLNDFIDLVSLSPIGHVIGLAIVERALFKTIPAGCVAIEHTFLEERSNVIFVRERRNAVKSIDTTWAFEGFVDPILGRVSRSECETTCKWECLVDDPDVPGMPPKHSNVHHFHHVQRPD